MESIRLDVLLIKNGMFSSRERAKEHIKKGEIKVDGKVVLKGSHKVNESSDIEFTGEHMKYVSRGGLKLEKAIEEFNIELLQKTCMDIGASTGGFTDCMLQNGAKKVYSIDVGTDQLHHKLKGLDSVVSMENCNIRNLTPEDLGESVGFISIDVSFISLTKVLPCAETFLEDGGEICALIKPQFECERKWLNKKGVVKNRKEHIRVIKEIIDVMYKLGFGDLELSYSPVKGPNGNTEYLLKGCKGVQRYNEINIGNIVEEATGIQRG